MAAFPVTHYLWLAYARYLEAHLRIGPGAPGSQPLTARLAGSRKGWRLACGRTQRSAWVPAAARASGCLGAGTDCRQACRRRRRGRCIHTCARRRAPAANRSPARPPPAVVNGVYARAVRNCPWVGTLWGRALRALERFGAPDDQHAALWEKALGAGLQARGAAAAAAAAGQGLAKGGSSAGLAHAASDAGS